MARMLDGMEQLLRGEVPPPAAATRILAAVADAAMGWAYMTTLGEGESYTTLEIKTNFLRPVRTGRLSARARVRSAGRTIGLVECDVLTADGKVAAYAVSTCMTLRGEAAQGR
jgi:uncharacterized protein (TIGR00369 family)